MRKRRPIERVLGELRDTSLVVLASEDTFAVKQYFERFGSTRIKFRVLPTEDGDSSPEHVMDRLEEYARTYDLGQDDQMWLVLDTDKWTKSGRPIQTLTEIMRRCTQKRFGVALTNPCFELWLLLHFKEPADPPLDECDGVVRQLRAAAGSYNKKRVFALELTDARVADAISRAERSEPESNRTIPDPGSTGVHWIIKELVAKRLIAVLPAPP